MKRLFFLCSFIILFAFTAFCGNEKPVPRVELPQPIQQFIDTNYHGIAFHGATYDAEEKEYEILMESGVKLEFNQKGAWKDIRSPKFNIFQRLLPEKLLLDFTTRAPRETIIEVAKEKKGYELKTLSGKEFHYSSKGKFLKMEKD